MDRKISNGLSEEKRKIIGQLIKMYDIKTAADMSILALLFLSLAFPDQ